MNKLLPLLLVAALPLRGQSSATPAAASAAFAKPAKQGLAYDLRSKNYFAGQAPQRKIVRVDARGRVSDFQGGVPVPAAGAPWGQQQPPVLGEVLGLQVDAAHRSLWACANGWGPLGKRTGLWEFDTRTGALRQLAFVTDTLRQHQFNELAVTAKGVVYATDIEAGGLYRMRTKMPLTEEIEAWLPDDSFVAPTGLCLNAEGSALYVVHARGIARVDVATKQITPVSSAETLDVQHCAGLYFHQGALLVLKNGEVPTLVRYRLDAPGLRLGPAEELALERPETPGAPTGGVVVGDTFYYTLMAPTAGSAKPLLRHRPLL